MLPRLAALEAIVNAISEQASTLDAEGQEAIEAVVKDSQRLADIVRRHLDQPIKTEA
jgi:hypothetical protein